MRRLLVSIEVNGKQTNVGEIVGEDAYSASFKYSDTWRNSIHAAPISISLPLREQAFSPRETRNFFEGLLPEGFLRKTIAESNQIDQSDYLTLLELLGAECLGAVQIEGDRSNDDTSRGYHRLDADTLWNLAREGAEKSAELVVESRLSLTGASGKIGVYRDSDGNWYLPSGSAPSTHILKQSHIRYRHIVQNEQLCQLTAQLLGIDIPKSTVISCGNDDRHEEVLFATERFDRTFDGSISTASGMPCPLRLHQEDFGQAMGIIPADKYERTDAKYMKKMFDLLRERSASPVEDQIKLWDMIVFHYLAGNTDGHIKNFSLLYGKDLKRIRLAPAYDMISTVIYDTHSSQMAFAIGGIRNWTEIDRMAFVRAVDEIGLNKKMFMDRFDSMQERFSKELQKAAGVLADSGYEEVYDIAEKIISKHQTR